MGGFFILSINSKVLNETNTFLLSTNGLPIMKNINDISRAIGISPKRIYEYSRFTSTFYKEFEIKKKNGTKRKINAPNAGLKLIQKWILENILYRIQLDTPVYGFSKGMRFPTKENAIVHQQSLFLFQTDIEDFFSNIKAEKVYYLFTKIGYNQEVSLTLTSLCTLNNTLPQGGVTSPYLSNLTCFRMDRRIAGLCQKRDIFYSRYADDITLSADNMGDLKRVKYHLEKIIKSEGFNLNVKKTRYSSHKKIITGLAIHEQKVLVPRIQKRNLRAKIYNSINNCDYSETSEIIGYISYINSIESSYGEKISEYIENILVRSSHKQNIEFQKSELCNYLKTAKIFNPSL